MKQETRMHVWYFAREKRTIYEVINDFRRHDSTLRVDNVANGYKMEWIGSVQSEMLNVEVQSETQQRERWEMGRQRSRGAKEARRRKGRGEGRCACPRDHQMRLRSRSRSSRAVSQSRAYRLLNADYLTAWLPCCSAPQLQMLIHSQHTAACKWAGQKQHTPAFNLAKLFRETNWKELLLPAENWRPTCQRINWGRVEL